RGNPHILPRTHAFRLELHRQRIDGRGHLSDSSWWDKGRDRDRLGLHSCGEWVRIQREWAIDGELPDQLAGYRVQALLRNHDLFGSCPTEDGATAWHGQGNRSLRTCRGIFECHLDRHQRRQHPAWAVPRDLHVGVIPVALGHGAEFAWRGWVHY